MIKRKYICIKNERAFWNKRGGENEYTLSFQIVVEIGNYGRLVARFGACKIYY
jgi:hypothetical protein